MHDCVFCKIVKGELPCYKIWEDDNFLAFLSINPPVEGLTILIPKKHYPSYFKEVENKILNDLVDRAKTVADILDSKLENVLRTKLVFEGLEIDHLHAKLYPMYSKNPKIPSLKETHFKITGK